MTISYSDRLKDPRWQRKRLEILNRSNFTCESCGAGDKTLHVHHKIYRKGAMPWEYTGTELQALCEDCHEAVTHVRQRLDAVLAELDNWNTEELLGHAHGLLAKQVIFGENYGDTPLDPRKWPLASQAEARGFLLCVCMGIDPALVDEYFAKQPLDSSTVEKLHFRSSAVVIGDKGA